MTHIFRQSLPEAGQSQREVGVSVRLLVSESYRNEWTPNPTSERCGGRAVPKALRSSHLTSACQTSSPTRGLRLTRFVTYRNQQSRPLHAALTRCAVERKYVGSELLSKAFIFHSSHDYFQQPSAAAPRMIFEEKLSQSVRHHPHF